MNAEVAGGTNRSTSTSAALNTTQVTAANSNSRTMRRHRRGRIGGFGGMRGESSGNARE
jgi:hypothetical protein